MLRSIASHFIRATEILLPRVCLVCDRPLRADFICRRCRPPQALSSVGRCGRCFLLADTSPCLGCELHPPPFDSFTCLWNYEEDVPPFIRAIKYRPSEKLCLMAADLGRSRILEMVRDNDIDLVVPMPRSWHGLLKRPRNHLDSLITAALKGQLSGKFNRSLRLTRLRVPQADLPHSRRRANVGKTLSASPIVKGAKILIVEDVVTTGSTLSEACRALRIAGASAIHVFALARASTWERYRTFT